jgi:diguanylate cyclase (GGDEF)-like protein
LYPGAGLTLGIVGVVEAAMWVGIAIVVKRTARRYLTLLTTCCALLVLPGPLLTIATLPAQYATTLAYLAVIPLAVALFVPWGPRAHVLWLVVYVSIGASFALSPLALTLTAGQRLGLVFALAGASLVSFVGQRFLGQAREGEFAMHVKLRELNRALAESARIDPLTGLSNRRQLSEDLVVLWDRHVRYGHGYCAVMLDLDQFKALNDRAGHLAGDATLQAVAGALRVQTRPGDAIYRFGGEEFLVVLPEVSPDAAQTAADRLRQAVEALAILHPDNGPRGILTISAGVALMSTELDTNVDDWLRRADAALYRAKEEGRNRVHCWSPPAEGPELRSP